MRIFFILVFILSGIAVFFFGNYAMVKAPDGYHLLKKQKFGFKYTYVDISKGKIAQSYKNGTLKKAVINGEIVDFRDMNKKLMSEDTAKKVNKNIRTMGKKIDQGIKKIDRKLGVSEKTKKASKAVAEKAKKVDKKYKISEKTNKAVEKTVESGKNVYKKITE